MNYGKELDRAVNIRLLADRILKEAETKEQFKTMLDAELLALANIYTKEYFDVTVYPDVLEFPNADYVAVGQVAETEEDFDNDNYGYIVPYSYMKNGNYIVHYKIIWKKEI